MGLGIGRQVSADFMPSPDTMHEPRPSGHIPSPLRVKLLEVVTEMQTRLTGALAKDENGIMTLWNAYRKVRQLTRRSSLTDTPREREWGSQCPVRSLFPLALSLLVCVVFCIAP
jgi:hypothetical protein